MGGKKKKKYFSPKSISPFPNPPAKVLDKDNSAKTFVGTPLYMPPELMTQACGYTFSADIFGFGLVLFELMTLRKPHFNIPRKLVCFFILYSFFFSFSFSISFFTKKLTPPSLPPSPPSSPRSPKKSSKDNDQTSQTTSLPNTPPSHNYLQIAQKQNLPIGPLCWS